MTEDRVGAFVPGPRTVRAGAAEGPLAGLTFAVKDLYDTAGDVTGYGNPDWARTHAPATQDAAVVMALLDAGARLVGKTKTVELAYGLTGENVWHGTPINPAAPDRFPGGSSCGSAAAVAAGLCDIAMGSDTGGSVRIPASYCGDLRHPPVLGRGQPDRGLPAGPAYDTAGWFAARAGLLRRAGEVLLPPGARGRTRPAAEGAGALGERGTGDGRGARRCLRRRGIRAGRGAAGAGGARGAGHVSTRPSAARRRSRPGPASAPGSRRRSRNSGRA